jgi:hypothetical protein
MTTTTYDQFVGPDPTESYTFRAAVLFEWVLARAKLRFLIEITRLLLLGFYEDFRDFVRDIEQAEDRSKCEAGFKAIWARKSAAAEKVATLVSQLESMGDVPYRGRYLVDYLLGRDRLEKLKLFVEATKLEARAEGLLDKAKREFLASFGKRKLTKGQRTALLQKYKELAQLASGSTETIPRT